MGRGVDIPWVGGQNNMGREVKRSWVGGRIPWGGGIEYHG